MSLGGKDLFGTDNDAKVWRLKGSLDGLGEALGLALVACFLLAGVFIFAGGIHEILANGSGVGAFAVAIICSGGAALLFCGIRPISPSVGLSQLGLTLRAAFQKKRVIPWHDMLGVIWFEQRDFWGTMCTLVVEVPQDVYRRPRVKLGAARHPDAITELRDEVVRQRGFVEVDAECLSLSFLERLVVSPYLDNTQVWRQTEYEHGPGQQDEGEQN